MTKFLLLCSAIVLCATAIVASAQDSAPAVTKAEIARGRYLVTRVAMCGDCHTPHDKQGRPLMSEWLQGAALPFKPAVPMPWVGATPAIAGLPQYTDEQMIKFLSMGETKTGGPPSPPMPSYRMSKADARAVTAYLRSLGSSGKAASGTGER